MKKIYILILFIGWIIAVKGQDIHFSQFYASPLTLNPANTGLFNGNIRGVLNYRNQWNSFAPFNTYAGSVDMNFGQRFLKDDLFGIGVNFFRIKRAMRIFQPSRSTFRSGLSKPWASGFREVIYPWVFRAE